MKQGFFSKKNEKYTLYLILFSVEWLNLVLEKYEILLCYCPESGTDIVYL